MNRKKILPLVIAAVLTIVAVVGGVALFNGGGSSDTSSKVATVTCIGGSEKTDLMADPDVQRILHDKYGVAVNFRPMGSYEQVQLSSDKLHSDGVGCLWPSSASAQYVFEATHKTSDFNGYQAAVVLQSPEVIYAGPAGTEALKNAGVVEQRGSQYFIVKMGALLLDYILKGATWDGLKASGLSGPVLIASTDAAKSNSGFTLSQLELNIIASGDPYKAPAPGQAHAGLAKVRALYDAQGLQARTSDDGFDQWLLQGGELHAPLYAGYENQIMQKVAQNRGNAGVIGQLQSKVKILYPEPTIYASHPILALTPDAGKLINGMKDPDIQAIAWKKYGFRSGTQLGTSNVADFKELQLASDIRTTTPPSADVTQLLLNCIQKSQCQ